MIGRLQQISIKRRMEISFFLVAAIFVLFAFYTVTQMRTLVELTETIYDHPLKVSNAALEAKSGLFRMAAAVKDLHLTKAGSDISLILHELSTDGQAVHAHLDIVRNQILGSEGKAMAIEAIDRFNGWEPIWKEIALLVSKGDSGAADRLIKEKETGYVGVLEQKFSDLAAYARKKADGFMEDARKIQRRLLWERWVAVGLVMLMTWLITYFITRSIDFDVSLLRNAMSGVSSHGGLEKAVISGKNEISEMAGRYNDLVDRLNNQFWFKDGRNNLSAQLAGDLSPALLADRGLRFLCRYMDACTGVLYFYDESSGRCRQAAVYASAEGNHFPHECLPGEGIVGQTALERRSILLTGIGGEGAVCKTGTVHEPPNSIYVVPILHENTLLGVLEIATFQTMTPLRMEFVDTAGRMIAVSLHVAAQKEKIKTLLEETRQDKEFLKDQALELQSQTEELTAQSEELQQVSAELREQNFKLENQRRRVEEASRLKSEFLSNMSHELRTPLNSVLALSNVLIMRAKEKLSKEEIGFLGVIERNGKKLLGIINDLLDLSKIEAGKMDIVPAPFSVRHTIQTLMEMLEPIAEEKGIRLISTVPESLPKIESDESRVYKILENLIGNAVKFTETGTVGVSVENDESYIHILIEDTGVGIPDDQIEHIFEEFRQVDGSTSRRFEGTGLGLTIALKATRMLGGKLAVKSSLGEGSTFYLSLPIKFPRLSPAPPPISNSGPHLKGNGNHILLIEDNEAAVQQVKMTLEDMGYRVETVSGGQEALVRIRDKTPDGVILDLMMPGMDGFEVLETIRRGPETRDIPVLILTAKDLTLRDREKLADYNIRHLIQKGDVGRAELLRKVGAMLSTAQFKPAG